MLPYSHVNCVQLQNLSIHLTTEACPSELYAEGTRLHCSCRKAGALFCLRIASRWVTSLQAIQVGRICDRYSWDLCILS